MDLTAIPYGDVLIDVENLYEGDLNLDILADIDAIPWSNWLNVWMQSLSGENQANQVCEMSLRLTCNRQMQALNSHYRSIDKPTDVLAFAATESSIILPPGIDEPLYLGDIVISLDTANQQAQSQNHPLVVELAWLSSHGLLHLLGWDHPDEHSLNSMLQRQSQLIGLLNI